MAIIHKVIMIFFQYEFNFSKEENFCNYYLLFLSIRDNWNNSWKEENDIKWSCYWHTNNYFELYNSDCRNSTYRNRFRDSFLEIK